MLKLHVNGSWMDFRDAMKNRDEFNAGAMRNGHGTLYGRAHTMSGGMGRLPEYWQLQFIAFRDIIDYVVYSYGTPIAWHVSDTDEWVMPDVKYSVTTSKHQGRIAPGCTQLNMVA